MKKAVILCIIAACCLLAKPAQAVSQDSVCTSVWDRCVGTCDDRYFSTCIINNNPGACAAWDYCNENCDFGREQCDSGSIGGVCPINYPSQFCPIPAVIAHPGK